LAAVACGVATPAAAQRNCRAVDVEEVRQRRVELFDLEQTPIRMASRSELGNVTRALECADLPDYLGIEAMGRRWLVRRNALQLRGPPVVLPVCAPGEYETYVRRNASSSGAGLPPCRRP